MAFNVYNLLFCFALVNGYVFDKTNDNDYLRPKGKHDQVANPDILIVPDTDKNAKSDNSWSFRDLSEPESFDLSWSFPGPSHPESSDQSWSFSDLTDPDQIWKSQPPESTAETSSEVIRPPNPIRQDCPDGQSSLYEKDIVAMIVYFANRINFTENLNASYFGTAVEYRDTDLKSITDFLLKFENRPKHLDHIIEDLANVRTGIVEPLVREVVSKRPEFSSLSMKHQQHEEISEVHLNRLEKSKLICELNCPAESKLLHKRSVSVNKIVPQDEYYCANVEEVSRKIISVLENNQIKFEEVLHNMVVNAHNVHEKQIEEIKSKLKEAAVREFGITMYDVLSLQDEYNHFIKLIQDENGINNVETQLSEIRKTNLEIEFQTEQLKTYLEKYRKHCLTCHSNLRHRRDISNYNSDASYQAVDIEYETDDVLDRLLSNYLISTKSQFQSAHATVLQELNEMLLNPEEFIQDALHKLEPIKEQIMQDLEHEEEQLNNLKKLALEALIADLSKLKENTSSLNRELEEALNFIHGVIQ